MFISGGLERLTGLAPKFNRGYCQVTKEIGAGQRVCSSVKIKKGRVRLKVCRVIRGTKENFSHTSTRSFFL